MPKINWPALLALLLLLSLTLAACTGPGGTAETVATAEPSAEEPVVEEPAAEEAAEEPAAEEPAAEEPAAEEGDRQIATFIWTQEFDTLSPLYTSMWFSTITYSLWNTWAWNFD